MPAGPMIYITNANAEINILKIPAGCREYRLFVAHNDHRRVLQRSQDPAGKGVEIGQLILTSQANL